jgi:hypothetical protein
MNRPPTWQEIRARQRRAAAKRGDFRNQPIPEAALGFAGTVARDRREAIEAAKAAERARQTPPASTPTPDPTTDGTTPVK